MTTFKALGVEIAGAVVAGLLSVRSVPGPRRTDPLGPSVFVFGRVFASVVNVGTQRTQRPLRVECAAGVAFIVFAGLQRVPGLSVLIAVVGALVAGLAVYAGAGVLSKSSGSSSEAGAGTA